MGWVTKYSSDTKLEKLCTYIISCKEHNNVRVCRGANGNGKKKGLHALYKKNLDLLLQILNDKDN